MKARMESRTTYLKAVDELLLGRDIEPRPNDRFVDNGPKCVSAARSLW
jgi:hypothetical protein